MDRETYFVVQTFALKRGYLMPHEAHEVPSAETAQLFASRAALKYPAVLAFSRTRDRITGDFAGAAIIARYGDVPDEAIEVLAA